MPICNKCDSRFPTWVRLDGKLRNLARRRYCLKCSPFGGHNTRQLHGREVKDAVDALPVNCTRCGREYVYDRNKGHKRNLCNSCGANRRRAEIKQRAVAYKGGECEKCGYKKCLAALGFHHRNGDEKDFQISTMWSRRWELVKRELDKCELLCANCHMEVHYQEAVLA